MCYWITAYATPWLTLEDFQGLSAHYIRLSRLTKLLSSVLPCMALHWCFRIIGCANVIGEPYSFSSVSEYVLQRDNVTMLEVWTVMLTYSLVMCITIWYMNNVLSWTRGVPLVPWFPLSPAYWLPKRQGAFQQIPPVAPDGVHFEHYPRDKQEVVFVNRLEYEEEHTHVLRDTNFKAYANELLAVMGPSGAGKTSLIRIMTGMQPPTGGQVIVEGYDVTTQTASACASMGVVLQRPVLFSDLTAYEHLLFFGGLAGLMGETLVHRAIEVKDMLLLTEVSAMMSLNMNASCKRRLDLAIAILLSPRVLILDEPMFGMDIASRYHVWNVLVQAKQKTCVIMTTSDIDDIDAVADRTAILGYGGLKCFGTPTFLRRRYGCGYNLHLTKAPNFQTSQVVEALQEVSKETRVLQDHKQFAIVNLGDRRDHVAVSKALQVVEQRQRQYGVESYKVGVITIEDIFLRVIMEIDASSVESKRRAALDKGKAQMGMTNIGATAVQQTENVMAMATADVGGFTQLPQEAYESSVQIQEHMQALYDLAAGKPRNYQIFLAMLTKRRLYMRQTLYTPLACWLLPSLLMFLVCRYQASYEERLAVHFGADLTVYDLATLHPESGVLLARDSASTQLADSFFRPHARSASLTVNEVGNMDAYMRNLKGDRTAHRSAVAGAEFVADADGNSGRAIAWYHGDFYHTQSASANLLGTALLRWASDDSQASMVSMLQPMRRRNHSIYSRSLRRYHAAEELHAIVATRLMRFILLPAATSVTAASFVLFAIDDRVSNSKAMQLMSGVPPLVYWMGNYVWDMLMSVISLFCMFFPVSFCDPMFFDVAPAVLCIFMAYVHSILAFVYWFSFFMDSMLSGFILVNVVASVSGTVCGLAYQLSLIGQTAELMVEDPPREPTLWLLYLLPPFSYTWALIKTSQKVAEENYCTGSMADVRDVCAYVHNSLDEGAVLLPNLRYCCAHFYASNGTSVSKLASFSLHRDGILAELLVMVAEGCILLLLLALFEKGLFRFWAPGKAGDASGVASPLNEKEMPPDVVAEARYVEKAVAAHDLAKPALLVLDLKKRISSLNVLRGLSFHVEPGEAFAVAGLRGCGKTTLLNVLSGSTMPTSGTALIGDVPLQNLAGWEQRIGVCPTHDSVLGRLTVHQTLRLYANIRGIRPEDIDRLLEHLILLLNLTQSVENTVEECGAVTRRKLAVAIAIIGLPPVVLMDDPATGLDLMSKRKIYRTISMLRQLVKSAVFIVTHSLSDCVVMSDRMAIMLEGQFQCVGTVAELRDRLCVGTVLLIKLSLSSAYDAEALKLVHMLVLKAFPSAVYNGRLGHSIEYTVTPSAPWSQLVPRVHELQVQVAAYASDVILTDMTLEHALLKIVKYQKPKVASTPAADAIAL
ncbi:phospholipid-transporting ATPase ABCA3-like [Amblyomma americanum]